MKIIQWITGIISLIFIGIGYEYSIGSALAFLLAFIFLIPPFFNLISKYMSVENIFKGQTFLFQIVMGFIFFLWVSL